jgi:hypothetical protein
MGLSKERAYGAFILILSIFSLLAYLLSFFGIWIALPTGLDETAARFHKATVELPVLVLVLAFLMILIRIGWNMLTEPSEKSLEEQEDALNQRI